MARKYRLNRMTRATNRAFALLTRWGLGAPYRHVLTVRGRATGTPRSTPVDVMDHAGDRWLVAPYGETNWVRNVRADPDIQLRRGRRQEHLRAEPVAPADTVPAIRAYLAAVPVTRRYWDVTASSTDAEIVADAATHPVFRLRHRGPSPLATRDPAAWTQAPSTFPRPVEDTP